MKEFPNFNLEEEFQNPSFRTALDFIAQQKNEQNEKTGRNDEIYDLTTAYKMAHFNELQKDLCKAFKLCRNQCGGTVNSEWCKTTNRKCGQEKRYNHAEKKRGRDV